jgi:hypothetical protein
MQEPKLLLAGLKLDARWIDGGRAKLHEQGDV